MEKGSRSRASQTPPNTPRRSKAPATPGRPSKRRTRLTYKQRKLLVARAENPDATLEELAQHAHYNGRANVSAALKSPAVKETMESVMAAHPGLTRTKIAQRIAEGLDAEKVQYFADKGRVRDERRDPDLGMRKGYAEFASKLRGDIVERKDITSKGDSIKSLILEDD